MSGSSGLKAVTPTKYVMVSYRSALDLLATCDYYVEMPCLH